MSDLTVTRLPVRKVTVSEPLAVAAVATAAVLVVVWGMSIGYTDVDVWGAFVVPTILAAITLPFLTRSRWLREEGLVGIASIALIAKFVGSYLRYLVEYHVYGGADSRRYHIAGVEIADDFLDGRRNLASLWPTSTGTKFLDELNGIVALLSGRTTMASFMVFSWFAFLGMLGFVAAARRAVPGVHLVGYATAVLFLPSMLFWSSALGKDAWMVFGMGLFAVGAARLFTGSVAGVAWALGGGYATAVVRPHVTALMLVAAAAGMVGRSKSKGRRPAYLMTIVVVAGLGGVASGAASDVLPNFDSGVDAVLSGTQERTATGGSEIEVVAPNSLLEYPFALVTVLFRPFLFEVGSPVQVLSALEGTALSVWVLSQRSQLVGALRQSAHVAYLRYAFVYVLAFGFAWASIGNLGIIARQRVQVIPLLLVVLFAIRPTSTYSPSVGVGRPGHP